MAARIEHGRAQLLTRTGLDWTHKYPSIFAALVNVKAKTAYIDGELRGVDDAGLPSFANKSLAEARPDIVKLVKALARKKPKGGKLSLRAISAELAAQGFLNERGKPFNPKSIAVMLAG